MPGPRLLTVLTVILVAPASALAAPQQPSFDPDAAAPYFAGGAESARAVEAMRRFRVEDWPGAARLFDQALKEKALPHREQAAFLAALARFRAGDFLDAATRFDALPSSYKLLLDYHHLYAARAFFGARKFEEALSRARLVGRPDTRDAKDAKDATGARPARPSPLEPEARFLRAEALRSMALLAEAEREYKAYLDAYPKSWRETEARYRYAEMLDARGKVRWREAKAEYLAVYVHAPTTSWARDAAARLARQEPDALKLGAAARLERGMAFFDEMRNVESEAELRAALAAGGLDATQQCIASYNLAQSVFKQRDRPRAAALFDDAARLCDRGFKSEAATATGSHADTTIVDLHMKALYQGGRCHSAKGELDEALACFRRAEQEHPTHTFADDARLRQAECEESLAKKALTEKGASPDAGAAHLARAELLLGDLADKYPEGDIRGEAPFRLAFRALRDGKLDGARHWLELELARFPREEGWWEAGRTLYWLARVAAAQQKLDEAKTLYARAAREYPLSYYAMAALNRLRERWREDEKKLVAELARPTPTARDLEWQFAPRPLFGEAGFLRGVELARLGLGAEARRELGALGMKTPDKGTKVEGPEAEELLWASAVLYDRAGEYALSHAVPRYALTSYSRAWPVGDNRKRWLLSYPRGYGDLVVEHAGKNGQPAALEFAIIREESAFDPLTESFANAVGLTQLTADPAKRFAQGLPFTREALRDPVINVTIGARELGDLWKKSRAMPAFTIAGYNAGEGRVRKWLKATPPGTMLDEFIESIPFDETRGYTKRVLASYFAYHWLYDDGDPVPVLPAALPGW